MTNCRRIRKKLSAFLDREVSPAEACGIEQHLAICPACRREARALTATYQLLELCPQAFRPEVHSLEPPARKRQRHHLLLPIPSWQLTVGHATRLLPIVTGLLVGAILGTWVWPRMSPPGSPTPSVSKLQSSRPQDAESFGGLARDPLEDVYVTLTSARSR